MLDTKVQTHELSTIEQKFREVDPDQCNKPTDARIFQEQKLALSNLLASKQLSAKRHRPKAMYLCGFENFPTMTKFWSSLPILQIEVIPNDMISVDF